MSLMSSLSSAVAGLGRMQQGIDVTSQNVANAQSDNYVRKEVIAETQANGSVRVADVQRDIDLRAQAQLRKEQSSAEAMDVIKEFTGRIDELFGRPEQDRSLAAKVGQLEKAFRALSGSPESPVQRQSALNAAQDVAQRLRFVSDQVQQMRSEADSNIADGVETINNALKNIADLNDKIAARNDEANSSAAQLKDRRDTQIDRISKLMQIQVDTGESGRVTIKTPDGKTLLTDNSARQLQFRESESISASQRFKPDKGESGLAGLKIVGPAGESDLMSGAGLRGGKMAGYIAARDEILVAAQNQLDELASEMTFAMSQTGSPVTYETGANGRIAQAELKLNQKTPGDEISVKYNQPDGTDKTITLTATAKDPAKTGQFEFSVNQERDALVNQVADKLTATVGAKGGFEIERSLARGSITVKDTRAQDNLELTEVKGLSQAGQLLDGGQADFAGKTGLNLFVDSKGDTQQTYLGRQPDGEAPQKRGFAQRIEVNSEIAEQPSKLVRYPADKIDASQETLVENQKRQATAPTPLPDNLKGKLGPKDVAQKDAVSFQTEEVEEGDRFTVEITDLPDTTSQSPETFSVTYTAAGTESPEEVRNALINRDASAVPGTFNFTGTVPSPATSPVQFEKGDAAGELVIKATTPGEGFRTRVSAQSGDAGAGGKLSDPGDATRARDLAARLGEKQRDFADNSGIGTDAAPQKDTVTGYAGSVVAFQANQAQQFKSQAEDQRAFANTLEKSFDNKYGVSTDEEMSNLIALQQSYAANARVLSTVDQMFNRLLSSTR